MELDSTTLGSRKMLICLLVSVCWSGVSALPTIAKSTAMEDSGNHMSEYSPRLELLEESITTIYTLCTLSESYTASCAWQRSKISKILRRVFNIYGVKENQTRASQIRAQAAQHTSTSSMLSTNKPALLERASLQIISYCMLNLSYCKTDLNLLLSNFQRPRRRG